MKVALVHELLTMRGGAERVLRVFADMFPEAPIHTLLYDADAMGGWIDPKRVVMSTRQRWAPLSTNHHLHLPWMPAAAEEWDFSGYDLVLSSSSAFAHGIITNGAPKHLCYVHSPARYLWDRTHDVLGRAGKGILGPLRRAYLERLFHRLRLWDAEAAARADAFIAPSEEVQRRIELYWRRESFVICPPIDDSWLGAASRRLDKESPYFLVVSTLAHYKRIDLAIRGCEAAGVTLKIAGTGAAMTHLQKIAGPHTEFLGFQTEEQLRGLYGGAQATIFPGHEDFGLVPLESMACGTPVIAYRAGGALETVIEGKTGTFFDEQTTDALADAIRRFDRSAFTPDSCKLQAKRFSRERFEYEMHAAIGQLLEKKSDPA
jgi:glycosyltransferase involved in cell wall biosynthesis